MYTVIIVAIIYSGSITVCWVMGMGRRGGYTIGVVVTRMGDKKPFIDIDLAEETGGGTTFAFHDEL
jgi:hypothetical protein